MLDSRFGVLGVKGLTFTQLSFCFIWPHSFPPEGFFSVHVISSKLQSSFKVPSLSKVLYTTVILFNQRGFKVAIAESQHPTICAAALVSSTLDALAQEDDVLILCPAYQALSGCITPVSKHSKRPIWVAEKKSPRCGKWFRGLEPVWNRE